MEVSHRFESLDSYRISVVNGVGSARYVVSCRSAYSIPYLCPQAIHSKTYADEAEEVFRMKVFKENAIRVAKHNERYQQGEVTFKVAINKHSDLVSSDLWS